MFLGLRPNIVTRSSVATLAVLMLGGAAVDAHAEPISMEPSSNQRVEVVSDEVLARLLGDPRIDIGGLRGSTPEDGLRWAQARVAELGRSLPVASIGAAAPDWHSIQFATRDWDDRDIPTRWGGYTKFGFSKIESVHNISNPKAIEAGYHGYPDIRRGVRNIYYAYLLVDGFPRLKIVSAADDTVESDYGDTPDGRPVGTITAYCEGYDQCPDAVNDA